MPDRQHKKRIKEELVKAGATSYGLIKSESRYLPKLIHPDEHIMGVVYGQVDSSSAMLVATEKRVIYLDCKPMSTLIDEITYETIKGVEYDIHTVFATLIMQTNIGNYTVRFANIKCAGNFANYLESKRIDRSRKVGVDPAIVKLPEQQIALSQAAIEFLQKNFVGVYSSVDREGNVYGAVVYYVLYLDHIYILTKSSTQKARNVYAHSQVSLTVFDEQSLQTAQLQGLAEVEQDPELKAIIFSHMTKARNYKGEFKLPPVAKNQFDSYVVIRVFPTNTRFSDFNG